MKTTAAKRTERWSWRDRKKGNDFSFKRHTGTEGTKRAIHRGTERERKTEKKGG